jgi:tRNA 2-(methylsulfanyl)-N6-isopentenyladenosine37 hydroxylase
VIDTVAHAQSLLSSATPEAWFRAVSGNLNTLLIDHANCEKKAAGTALSLLYRYVDKAELLRRMSRLAREELRHYEQVLAMIDALGYSYGQLTPGRYAGAMRGLMRTSEPGRLIDTLIVGAIVEARSCERFEGLANRFDGRLGAFYVRLLESEARHANVYLDLARQYARAAAGDMGSFDARLSLFVEQDRVLVTTPDAQFRFHSGPPAETEST